jgi:hypothetical protein
MTECLASECNLAAKVKGMCQKHYSRFKRHGDCMKLVRNYVVYKECDVEHCHNKLYRDYRCLEHYRYRGKYCED